MARWAMTILINPVNQTVNFHIMICSYQFCYIREYILCVLLLCVKCVHRRLMFLTCSEKCPVIITQGFPSIKNWLCWWQLKSKQILAIGRNKRVAYFWVLFAFLLPLAFRVFLWGNSFGQYFLFRTRGQFELGSPIFDFLFHFIISF